jgi:streptogramin lyase
MARQLRRTDLGKLDPRSGEVTEYPVPLLKPKAPTGILGMRFDRDQNLWLGLQFQGGIAKFDRKTEKFQTWSLPPHLNGDHVQVNQVSPDKHHVDGKVWLQDAGTYTVLRLDIKSGTFEAFEPYKVPRPNVSDVIPDSMNNGFFLVMGAEESEDRCADREITIFKTPTPGSGPRRGMMDAGRSVSAETAPIASAYSKRGPASSGMARADARGLAVRRHRRQER